jgi:hypothetical protein
MKNDARTEALLDHLDGSGSDAEWIAVERLRERDDLPHLLLERFRSSRAWKTRSSCVYHAVRYAPRSDDAIALGKEAIADRSKVVRYRGCMLLAYSQKREALLPLKEVLEKTQDAEGRADLLAAIDAIESGNHNFFVDREHSGKVTLTIS